MLVRDKYQGDPVMKFFPDFSPGKYIEHISLNNPYYALIFNDSQRKRWEGYRTYDSLTLAILCLSMIPVIFHKRISGLKKFTSRKGRILWGLCFIFIPTNIVNFIISRGLEGKVQQSYQLNADDFARYRMNGDITLMNSQIKFLDI